MKRAYFVCLIQFVATTFLLSQSKPLSFVNPSAISLSALSSSSTLTGDAKAQGRILDGYGKLPLSFEANHGQTDARVKFLSRTGGDSLFLTAEEAVIDRKST